METLDILYKKEKTNKPITILRLVGDNELIQDKTNTKCTANVLGGNSGIDARKARLLYYGKI